MKYFYLSILYLLIYPPLNCNSLLLVLVLLQGLLQGFAKLTLLEGVILLVLLLSSLLQHFLLEVGIGKRILVLRIFNNDLLRDLLRLPFNPLPRGGRPLLVLLLLNSLLILSGPGPIRRARLIARGVYSGLRSSNGWLGTNC